MEIVTKIINFFKSKIVIIFAISTLAATNVESLDKLYNYSKKAIEYFESNNKYEIHIGMKMDDVDSLLGKPNEVSVLYSSYFSDGIKVSSDYENNDLVGGVTATKLKSGASFNGKLQGLKLGMSIDDINSVLGKPNYWGVNSPESSTALWEKDEIIFIVQYKPNKNDKWFAYEISYGKPSSLFTYESILKVSVQELKAGRVPKFLDGLKKKSEYSEYGKSGTLKLERFIKEYLNLDHELYSIQVGVFGGAYLTYIYENGDILNFWIYPLGWESPEIRQIINMKEFINEKVPQQVHNR